MWKNKGLGEERQGGKGVGGEGEGKKGVIVSVFKLDQLQRTLSSQTDFTLTWCPLMYLVESLYRW